jgi:hypothetical protein
MVTPDGAWRVEVICTQAGELFRVRRRAIIGAHGGRGWAPTGQLRFSVTEVAATLGDAFADLVVAE